MITIEHNTEENALAEQKGQKKKYKIGILRINVSSASYLHYKCVSWSVLWHSNPINSLGTFWIIVVQVCDIDCDRCHSLTLF